MSEPGALKSWDDLFTDLGLPPETSPAPTEASPKQSAVEAAPEPVAAPSPEPVPTDKEDSPPSRGRRRRSPPAVAPIEEPAEAEPVEQSAALAIESVEASVPSEEPTMETAAGEPPAVEGGEESPAPRGRSRRRRRGRGSKSAAAVPGEPGTDTPIGEPEAPVVEASEFIPPATESEEESGQRPRRRRSRGRAPEQEEAPRVVAVGEDDEAPREIEEEELEPVGRDEEVDDLSNWNVPSWAELIGSLYRPDR